MKIAMVPLVVLLAACASTNPVPLDQPLVVALDWRPAPIDDRPDTTLQPKDRRIQEEMLALMLRNRFSTTFGDVSVVDETAAAQHPTRVDLKISELATATLNPLPKYSGPYERPDPSSTQRCGTVEYALVVEGRETARQEFPLDCEMTGRIGDADYEKAAQRAVDEVARALRQPHAGQPLVVDFRWRPPVAFTNTNIANQSELALRQDLLAALMRDHFDVRFESVLQGADPAVPARVEVTVAEAGGPIFNARMPERCGTVTYAVFVEGREASREKFVLGCDTRGEPDYPGAGRRVAEAAARAFRTAS